MPKLYPGIQPLVGRGQYAVFFLTLVFFPFFLLAQPTISSFSPLSGPIGTTVTITGSNFNATPANNIVYFGAAKATVTAATTTALTVKVPVGTSYEPVSVTVGGRTAWSANPFNVIFSDPGQFTPQTFSTKQGIPTNGPNPSAICAKDFDGDGKTDLAVVHGQGVTVFNNTGTTGFPNFAALPNYSTPDIPVTIATGDIDGDGKPDLVVSLNQTPKLCVFLNTSTPGNISFSSTPATFASSFPIVDIVVLDINGDGYADIVTSNTNDDNVSIYVNNGSGSPSDFTRQDLPIPPGASPYPGMVVAADMDGDGMPDIACADFSDNEILVFQNTGTRGAPITATTFVSATPLSAGGVDGNGLPPAPVGLAAGDLDGDGKIDLVAANQYHSNLVLYRNTSSIGNISFATETTSPATPQYPQQLQLLINDLDGDGKPDVGFIAGDDSISVYRNISTPGHVNLSDSVNYLANFQAWWAVAGDVDGDGLPDVTVVNNGASTLSVLINKKTDGLNITSFTPASGPSGTVVTITGTNFSNVTAVSFGGTAATSFTIVSPTTITATVGAGASGLVMVTDPGSFATKDGFNYTLPPLTITSFSPQTGGQGTVVLIEGTGFISNQVNSLVIGGTPVSSYNVNSDTEISAVVGNGSTGYVKAGSLANTATSTNIFTYTSAVPVGPPTISSFAPLSAMQGAQITINGSNLSYVKSVTFGGVPAQSFDIRSDNLIYAIVAAGATGDVSVTDSLGTGTYPGFTFLTAPPPPAPPRMTSFSPKTANNGATVTIKGVNLSDVTTVSFGGLQALSFKALSDTVITAIVGAGSTGNVKVASAAGADSLAGFVFAQPDTTQTTTPPSNNGPFQLMQFSGAINNNQPRLSWQVRNDGSIAYYAIERAIDGNQFKVIGTIPANNKTGIIHNYTFTDLNPKTGINYYRLKMQDTTTHYTYSSTLPIQTAGTPQLVLIHPNPAKYGFFFVDLPSTTNQSVYRLCDLNGKAMQTGTISAGVSQQRINIPGLPRGTYQFWWSDGTHTISQTILVL